MKSNKLPSWPSYTTEEAEAVSNVILSNKVNYWTGQEVRNFEEEFAEWVGVRHAVALSNGTVALEAALRALGVSSGDEVIVTPRSFIASVSCVVNVGAIPVFADVDIDSGNITASTIASVLTNKTKAIICVHLAGWPCDMDPIMDLATKHGIFVIEDCAQAHGAKYKGKSVGSIGHVGAWSFCQDKIMTTGGEGGMVTTHDESLWHSMWSYKDHGKSYKAVYEKTHPEIGFRWVHESFGTNWRMLETQAVIGRIQLRRMKQWHMDRRANTNKIWETARRIPALRVPEPDITLDHAAYKCYVYVTPEKLRSGWSRDRILSELNAAGVPCSAGSCSEIYAERAFDETGWRPDAPLPVARCLGETSLMFMVHPTLTAYDIEFACNELARVMNDASCV